MLPPPHENLKDNLATLGQVKDVVDGVKSDVSELKEDLTSVKDILNIGYTFIEPTDYYDMENKNKLLNSNGTLTDNSNYDTSDYVDLSNVYGICKVVTRLDVKYNLGAMAFYDANKTFKKYKFIYTDYDFDMLGDKTVVWYPIEDYPFVRFSNDRSKGENVYVVYKKQKVGILDGYAKETEVNEISNKVKMLTDDNKGIVYKTGMECIRGIWIDTTGSIFQTSSTVYYDTTNFIECKPNEYYFVNCRTLVLYDSSKKYISGQTVGDGLKIVDITNENVSYIRASFYNNLSMPYYGIFEKKTNYDIVNLGDSIFGLQHNGFDISYNAQVKSGHIFANCGYGGTTAGIHQDSNYDIFTFHALADAIYNGDFSTQEASTITSAFYKIRTETLKEIDFDKVKLITIAYGTNDWNFGIVLDNKSNKYDVSTYCGGLRYGIEKILSKYPKIQLCLMSPTWRTFTDDDSDSHTNVNGNYLKDFCDAMKGIAEEYHIPFFDHYNIGINKFNYSVYLRDGTHPTYIDGIDLLSNVVASDVKKLLN